MRPLRDILSLTRRAASRADGSLGLVASPHHIVAFLKFPIGILIHLMQVAGKFIHVSDERMHGLE